MPRRPSSPSHSSSLSSHTDPSDDRQIPYRDADPEHGELPLDDIDTFLIRATDEKGTASRVSFNVPPVLERDILIIIRTGRFPYLRDSDFWRHAGVRHIEFLSSIRQSVPKSLVPALELMGEICREDENRTRTEEILANVEARISHHLSRSDYTEVIRLVNLLKQKLENVDVSSSWRRDFAVEFYGRYSRYLNHNVYKDGDPAKYLAQEKKKETHK